MLQGATAVRFNHKHRFPAKRTAPAFFLSALCFLAVACCLPVKVFAQPQQRSVLVLDQSSSGLPFNTAVATAVRLTLIAESPSPISFYSEHLDANRFFGPEYEEDFVRFLKDKYRDRHIDAMIVFGVSALDFIERRRGQIWPSVPVIFVAIDEATIAARPRVPNVTGATMQLSMQDMVRVARMIIPDLKAIAIVGDPLERQTFYRHFRAEIPAIAQHFTIIDLMNLPLGVLKERLGSLPDKTAVIYTGIYYTSEGISHVPAELTAQIAAWANRPVVINVSSYLNKGAIGGYIVQADPLGREAARLALRILKGESASDIPIAKVASPLIFEWPALQRFNVKESALPPGSEVRLSVLSGWEQYRWQILGILAALLLQAALITWLIYEHQRRTWAEVQSRNSMAELTRMNRVSTAGELSASIAHEMGQPITGMVLRANAALRWLSADKPDLEKIRGLLNDIVAAGQRAGDIITSVRAMFKKDTAPKKTRINVNNLINTVLAIVRVDLQSAQVRVETRLDEQLPDVEANAVQLQQVILNVVVNAVDAMRAVQPRVLTIRSASDPSGTILVSIADSGAGVDPADRERVFDKLFTTKTSGMGMGLSICRTIIEDHGGRIWVMPATGRGAIFEFELPAKRPASVSELAA
jgi:signal transduction histidine kinase